MTSGLRFAWVTVAIVATSWPPALAQEADRRLEPPANLGTSVTIAGPKEPGTRMIVTGRVVDARGRPRAGIVIGVYQTDARGFYGENTLAAPIARLHGWVKTDSQGRYEVRTIRPGAYPTGGTPAHIHFIVNHWNEELRFATPPSTKVSGSSHLPRAEAWMIPPASDDSRSGTFSVVRPVTRDRNGVEHVVRDFRLK